MKKVILSTLMLTMLTGCWSYLKPLWPDSPGLANTPYMRNHTNPQSNDSVPLNAPGKVRLLWQALDDYSFFNPCTSGPEGNLYCSSYKDPALGQCNFIALDYKTGNVLWTDADSNGGACLLDEYTFVNSPMVDSDGNIYTSDSQRVVSFASDGSKRWESTLPQELTTLGGNGRVNNTFGFNQFTTGELVSATLGDAFVVVMNPADGSLYSEPFNLPAEKLVSATPFTRPTGHLEKFGGVSGADAVWNSSFADQGNENDNDISIDPHTDTVFIVSAAEGPNDLCEEPVDDPSTACGDGKLWALQYDAESPELQKVSIVFSVRFRGPGGSATTPAISDDGQYVVFADASAGLRVADIPRCLAEFADTPATAENNYNECPHFSVYGLPSDLLASPTVTPDNVIMVLGGTAGVLAMQIDRAEDSSITVTEKFVYGDDLDSAGNPVDELPVDCGPGGCSPDAFITTTNPSSVITAFNNVTYFSYNTLQITGLNPEIPVQRFSIDAIVTPGLVAINTKTGDEVAVTSFAEGVGDASNITMAADRRTLIKNNFNFVTQIAQDRKRPLAEQLGAGLSAWVPVRTETPIKGAYLGFSGNEFEFRGDGALAMTPYLGGAEDPQLHGANIKVFNPSTGEKQVIELPIENWTFVEDPELEGGGYRYSDPDRSEGPCELFVLTDVFMEASCGGDALEFSLDEASQGALGIALGLSPSRDFCAYFGGDSVTQDIAGEFHAGAGEKSQACIIP